MRPSRNQQGMVMTSALLLMVGFMAMALTLIGFVFSHFSSARRSLIALNALEVAEAGAEDALYNINRDPGYDGTHPPSGGSCNVDGSSGQVTFFNDATKGLGKYETCIQDSVVAYEKIVYSVGRVHLPASSQPVVRKIRLIIKGSVPFEYGIQSGNGPIYLYGNTGFSATAHSNDWIRIQDNGVSVTGGTITVSGTDTTGEWPNTCSIDGNGSITGGVIKVVGQLTPSPPNCGVSTSGSSVTENDATIVDRPLPTIDRDVVDAGITDGNRNCNELTSPSGAEPYTILKAHYNSPTRSIDGSCSYPNNPVKLKQNKRYNLTGNVHIRGDLVIDGNIITIDNSVTSPPHILVDGTITLKGNGVSINANTSGIGAIFAAYDTFDASACTNKNANNNTGHVSRNNLETAVDIQGNSLSLFANFLTPNGSIAYKARGSVGKIAGKCIFMNGSGLTTFIDIGGSSSGDDLWDVKHYQQVFD